MDTPRGRIYLMEALANGAMELTPAVQGHFDRCLGCMACVTSCPSGVQYDRLIELTRHHVERHGRRSLGDRVLRSLIFATFPHPRRTRAALALAPIGRRLPLPRALRPLLDVAPPFRSAAAPPSVTPAVGAPVGRAGLLLGCVQRVVFGNVNTATASVLSADGWDVVVPSQACCGALSVHAGRLEEGLARARRLIASFEAADLDVIVTNAAGCGSNLRDYGNLLADDPVFADRASAFSAKVRDVSEVVAGGAVRAKRHPLELRVAFQDSCHLLHAQRVREAPRAALRSIPGLELTEPAEQEICCGSAGIYNLVQPIAAAELGARKAGHVLATKPDAYATANPGCLIQVTAHLRHAGEPLAAFHPVELLAASIAGTAAARLVAEARR
jgi:glycolate oxidase iron-sulfur subunit